MEGIRKSTLELASHLAAIDPHFNDKSLPVRFEERFFGPGYGQGTKEGDTWTKRARDLAGVELEATYTAKVVVALASLSPELRAKRVLLWASQPVYRAPADNDCRALPPALRAYCA